MPDKTLNESLDEKAAVVTGASSGIGRAVARALAARGARVTLVARRGTLLSELAAELGEDRAQAAAADFSREEEVKDVMAAACAHWGNRLDILVNAAGVARMSPLRDGDAGDWRTMWEINVLGAALASREALRYFPEDEGGHIVNLCSLSGHRVPGSGGFYAATKFAVRAMTEGLRQELRLAGNRTRVSQISPGFVDTPMLDEYFAARGTTPAEAVDYEMLRPEDIAAATVYLLEQPRAVEVNDVLMRPAGQAT